MEWKNCLPCFRNVKKDVEEVPVEANQQQFDNLERLPTNKKEEIPEVPFTGELPVPVDVGLAIEIDGETLPYSNNFSVNLTCGSTPTSDVAFHLNPRFDQNHVVRNSYLGGRWGKEECTASQRNPFRRGMNFYLIILAAEDGFMVSVNNYHFCSYIYRTPRTRIKTVQIDGDVVVNSLEYHISDIYPKIQPHIRDPLVNISSTTPFSDSIKDNVVLPILGNLPTGLLTGQEVEIVGRTKLLPHSFFVNLQSGTHMWPHPDIMLHINPRFQTYDGYKVIMNIWYKGKWGNEKKFPLLFKPGRPFSTKILCKHDEYSVTVDGVLLGAYPNLFSLHTVNTLYIQGDVLIKEVTVS